MIKVTVKTLDCFREPVPEFLAGLEPASLADLAWTAPSLGVRPYAWWPEDDQSAPLTRYSRYGDETLTADPVRKVVVVNKVLVPWSPAEILADKQALMAQIDDLVAERLTRSTRFQMGYVARETASQIYKDAGYTGTPSTWITRFANNTGKTAKEAADLILTQATGLRGALQQLEDYRMDKYQIMVAPTGEAALAKCNELKVSINAVQIP